MNNTILMIWSGGLCRQFCGLIKRDVFVSGPGKAARSAFAVYRSTKQTKVMKPCYVIRRAAVHAFVRVRLQGMPLRLALIKLTFSL